MWRNMMRTAPDPTARVASMYGMFTMLSALERTTRATRGMIGTVSAAMTFAIWSSPVPSGATTAIAMTSSGKPRRTPSTRGTSGTNVTPTYARRPPSTQPARSVVADPRIQHHVDHVDHEVDEDEDRREEQHQGLDERVVAVRDRVDEQLADAVEVEDLLGDDEAADEEREFEADDGDDWQ